MVDTSVLFSKPAQERLQKKTTSMVAKIRSRRPEEVKLAVLAPLEDKFSLA